MRLTWYALMLMIGASGCALVKKLLPVEPPLGMTERAVRTGQGAEVLAGGIAMQDLLQFYRADLADSGALAPDGGVQASDIFLEENIPAALCDLIPSNYDVWVEPNDAGTRWYVQIWPEGDCNKNSYGGGGEWEIDAESFEILSREYWE